VTLGRRIWHLANLGLALLLLLTARLGYWTVARGRELQPVVLDPVEAARQYTGDESPDPSVPVTLSQLPQPVIQRTVAALTAITRGTIYDRHGRPLAYSETLDTGQAVRRYPEPSLAHVIGYVTGLGTGAAGLEHSQNLTLLGLDRLDTRVGQLIHEPVIGSDLVLTVDSRTQRAAAEALGGRAGAVVALDARTGAVLAMVSAPGYDPNRVLEPGFLRGLAEGGGAVLLNRATQGVYTPGSTWKTVTLIGALDAGTTAPDRVFDFGPPVEGPGGRYYVYEVGGGAIIDPNHPEQVLDLTRAYAASANAAFARMGDELGGERFLEYAARLGIGGARGAPPIEIEAVAGQVANDPAAVLNDRFLLASSAIGQGEVLASPLQLALIAAAVVNEGDVPRPHLILSVRHPSGRPLAGEPRGPWIRGAMRPRTAEWAHDIMVFSVAEGGGRFAQVPGLTVGGKTGTAQLGGDQNPHALFIGFAEDGTHAVAIAVVVDHGGSGAEVAAPIFAQVAEAAMRNLKELPD
jgi:peptidoglycan glycosyltransferase